MSWRRMAAVATAGVAGLTVAAVTAQGAPPPNMKGAVGDVFSFATSQSNNNGPALSPGFPFGDQASVARCPGGTSPTGFGLTWSFEAPADPATTPAAIRMLAPPTVADRERAVSGTGTSDTDAQFSRFRTEARCLAGKARRHFRRSRGYGSVASQQVDNNGATISSGPVRARCTKRTRAVGWFSSFGLEDYNLGTEFVIQLASAHVQGRNVTIVQESDVDAERFVPVSGAICLRSPKARGLKIAIRQARSSADTSGQANNAGGVVPLPPVTAKCRRGERVASGGGFWRFVNPVNPAVTPAQLQEVDLAPRKVTIEGGSDTRADRSILIAQAVCLKRV